MADLEAFFKETHHICCTNEYTRMSYKRFVRELIADRSHWIIALSKPHLEQIEPSLWDYCELHDIEGLPRLSIVDFMNEPLFNVLFIARAEMPVRDLRAIASECGFPLRPGCTDSDYIFIDCGSRSQIKEKIEAFNKWLFQDNLWN